jgi:hypothetical protein
MHPHLVHLDFMLDFGKHYLVLIIVLATLGIVCTNSGLQKHHLQNGKSVYSVFYQKGNLSNPWNYRDIMMIENAYKIIANILLTRLKPIKESVQLDHECQNGFRWKRDCMDSIFTLKQLINKRANHGLETWLLLIDLVKAFDRVPRELLWEIMTKQGVPIKLVSLLKALHKTVKVKFIIDDVEQMIDSVVKQTLESNKATFPAPQFLYSSWQQI